MEASISVPQQKTNEIVPCSTGNHLIALDKSELHGIALNSKPIVLPYNAYIERLRGFAFLLKKLEDGGLLKVVVEEVSYEDCLHSF